jgi:phosphoserine phosphatase RsbU/P
MIILKMELKRAMMGTRVDVPKPSPGAFASLYEQNARLRRAVEELSLLNELASEISATFDLDTIMQRVVQRSLAATGAEQGVITIIDRKQPGAVFRTLVRGHSDSDRADALHPPESLVGWMQLYRAPLVINDVHPRDRQPVIRFPRSVRTVLSVPLMVRGEITGLLTLYNKPGEGFLQDDERLIAIIASQSAHVIENARLLEEEKSHLRVKEELRLARRMQETLLPASAPDVPGYDIAGTSIPALEVGGDYFDFVGMDDGRLAIAVGDVVGKGLPAALLMANLQATLRGQLAATASLAECMACVNEQLFRTTRRETFVTLFVGILDPQTHLFEFANAGHNRPLIHRADGSIEELSLGGLVLGVRAGTEYEVGSTDLAPGEVLLTYSDGLTEARDGKRAEFEEDRLYSALRSAYPRNAADILNSLNKAVERHVGSADPTDDITMIILKRTQ